MPLPPIPFMGKLSEDGAGPEAFYQNKEGKWCRVRVLLLKGYTAEYPWVLVTLEDQAGEVEKRLNEAVSQEAVSRMYRLVVSVDLKKTEYHCVHYSGEQLQLSKREFYRIIRQIAQKMPSERPAGAEPYFPYRKLSQIWNSGRDVSYV